MFRMWGKIFHENHMLKDTVICIDSDLIEIEKYIRHWKRYVMNLIFLNHSGLITIKTTLSIIQKPDLILTVL